jgi:prepilin-type N-terminal cleavage/methylation domain-containing protein
MEYSFFSKIKPLQQGYTMLEVLMVVAIAAILVAVAMPSLQDTISRNARDSIQLDLLTSLALARTQAVTLSVTASVCHSANQTSCSNSAGSDWNDGWLVFSDFDSDGVIDSADGDEILQVHPAANGVVAIELLNSSNNTITDEFVQFDNDGFLNNSTGGAYFKFCDPDNTAANSRAIWVTNSGRASQSIDDGDGVHDDLAGADLACP